MGSEVTEEAWLCDPRWKPQEGPLVTKEGPEFRGGGKAVEGVTGSEAMGLKVGHLTSLWDMGVMNPREFGLSRTGETEIGTPMETMLGAQGTPSTGGREGPTTRHPTVADTGSKASWSRVPGAHGVFSGPTGPAHLGKQK